MPISVGNPRPSTATLPSAPTPAKASKAPAAPPPPPDSFSAGTFASPLFPASAKRRSSWAWDSTALNAPGGLDKLLTTVKSAGANELCLNAYPLLGRVPTLTDAVKKATAKGIQPQLLMGAPEWIDPKTRSWLEKSIVAPLKAIRTGVPTTTLRKLPVHLDIEPHTTGPLTAQSMRAYLDTLSWMATKLGTGFSLEVDIPVWYAGQKVDGKSFTEQILQRVDGVTLMAYERTADQILTDVAPTLALAAKAGKKATVAVEVGPQYRKQGLATQREVRAFMAKIEAGLSGKPGYAGCALHDLAAMKALPA